MLERFVFVCSGFRSYGAVPKFYEFHDGNLPLPPALEKSNILVCEDLISYLDLPKKLVRGFSTVLK